MTRIIPLTHGYFTYVDDADYEWLMQWKWRVDHPGSKPNIYAVRSQQEDGKQQTVFMHRLIMDTTPSEKCDHINRLTLDNRRSNLRPATTLQNAGNVGPRSNNYKGVSWSCHWQRWVAHITRNRVQSNLGSFDSAELAALAYDRAAREHFGEYAFLNRPDITDYAAVDRQRYKPYRRFTDGEIRSIRRAKEEADLPYRQLARTFGVHGNVIKAICERKTYKDIQ